MNTGKFIAPVVTVATLALAGCGAGLPNTANAVRDWLQPVVQVVSTAQPTTVTNVPAQPSQSSITITDNESKALIAVYKQINPSVVNIQVTTRVSANNQPQIPNFPGFPSIPGFPGGRGNGNGGTVPRNPVVQGEGSGFVYDNNGDIITNNHVAGGASDIEVTFADGTILTAKLVGADPDSDLAVVQVQGMPADAKPLTLADSNQVEVGQQALAIGNPFGLQGTLTHGIVSAKGRTLPAGDTTTSGPTFSIPEVIQTDAPINPGNSGGPLLDIQGQVIGINTAIRSDSGSNSGIGFAIPSNEIARVVPQLIKAGHYDHPWLGISGGTVTPTLAQALKLGTNQGVLINEVTQGGPALQAGLKGGDHTVTVQGYPQAVNAGGDVITAIDGKPVKRIEDIIGLLESSYQPGQSIKVTVVRNGQEQVITVTLAKRPATSA